jgi:hypothetical protein
VPKSLLKKVLGILTLVFSIPIGITLVQQQALFRSKADGIPAHLIVNVGTASQVEAGIWKNLAQGGEEKNPQTFSPVVAQVKALSPEYIRIDHVFDFYDVVSRAPDGSLTFTWTKLDTVLSDIEKMGAKPFIALSYMPLAISVGNETDAPKNWNEWTLVVQKTVEHISGTQAKDAVYYEVGNEPDLFGSWKLYGEKNYLPLYEYAVKGAQNAQNVKPFKIGGPATTALYKNWFTDFLSYARDHSLRVDFYSWHRYSKDFEAYEKDIQNVHSWLEEFPQFTSIEFLISEAGIDSQNNVAYDGILSAIHTLALATLNRFDIARIFNFEIKDGAGPAQYWNRWGIMTHEKYGAVQKKPRYQALQFANELEGKHLSVTGQGTWIKAMGVKDGNVSKVLLVNYDPDGKHTEAVPVVFDRVPKTFTYRRKNFLGQQTAEKTVTLPDGQTNWQTLELMEANSAAILELTSQ